MNFVPTKPGFVRSCADQRFHSRATTLHQCGDCPVFTAAAFATSSKVCSGFCCDRFRSYAKQKLVIAGPSNALGW